MHCSFNPTQTWVWFGKCYLACQVVVQGEQQLLQELCALSLILRRFSVYCPLNQYIRNAMLGLQGWHHRITAETVTKVSYWTSKDELHIVRSTIYVEVLPSAVKEIDNLDAISQYRFFLCRFTKKYDKKKLSLSTEKKLLTKRSSHTKRTCIERTRSQLPHSL